MSEQAKMTHDLDQMFAAATSIGVMFANMFRGMRGEGMTNDEALTVLGEYARGMAAQQTNRQGPSEAPE